MLCRPYRDGDLVALLDGHQYAGCVQFLGGNLGCKLHAGISPCDSLDAEPGLQGRKYFRAALASRKNTWNIQKIGK